ncbi:uncharacterized protein METZ01_LOCUS452728, partial [marine metagenome]
MITSRCIQVSYLLLPDALDDQFNLHIAYPRCQLKIASAEGYISLKAIAISSPWVIS